MKNHTPLLSFAFILLLNSSAAVAQCSAIGWSSDPAVNLNVSPWGANPRACTDSKGGVYISFNLNTTPFTSQWIQWVDRCGNIRWPQPVEIIGEQDGTEYHPSLAADGFGGAIIAYTEWRVTNQFPFVDRGRIRVNRIDSSGTLLWGATGVRASLKDTAQYFPQVVPDGLGGAFVSTPTEDDSLFVQHISASGQRLWGGKGLTLGDIDQSNAHVLKTDQQQGIIIHWVSSIIPNWKYFKRINNQGNVEWSDSSDIYYPTIAVDNSGITLGGGISVTGALINIVANRLSINGQFIWGRNGITIADSVAYRSVITDVKLRPDSITAIFWTNVRDIFQQDYTAFVQFITIDGNLVFQNGSTPVSSISNQNFSGSINTSEDTSLLFSWIDLRNMNNDFGDLYMQRFGSLGEPLWDTTDVLVTEQDFQSQISVSDLRGGAILVWTDPPLHGIFAQQVNKDGVLGTIVGINNALKEKRPESFILYQNYPNPFNPLTTIRFELKSAHKVNLNIYNISGQLIKTLVKQRLLSGTHMFNWDGCVDSGQKVSSGIYLYRLITGSKSETKKMLLIH